MLVTPLHDAETELGAVFGEDAGWDLPARFGDPADEAARCSAGAGVADLSHWGRFTLRGTDSVKFLQGLVTNDVAKLKPGTGCYCAILNAHGRIESDLWVFRDGDGLLLITPPESAGFVETFLGRFRLAGDFQFSSIRDTHVALVVAGNTAAAVLGRLLGESMRDLDIGRCARVSAYGDSMILCGVRRARVWTCDIVAPVTSGLALYKDLQSAGDTHAMGTEALELLGLEGGVPRFRRDFDNDTVLQEIDVPDIVSFHKGCYLGQEIVARIHFQGQPGKLLRRLDVEGGELPAAGDPVIAGDSESVAGKVTASRLTPGRGPVVFAMIKRKFYAPGTPVRVARGEAMIAATVAIRSRED